MKKLVSLVLFISGLVFAINFHGHQSLSGLQRTALFTAPVTGPYFIKGTLTLPQLPAGSSAPSQALVSLYKNGSTVIYTGVTGASGFSMNGLVLVPNDAITVGISSSAAIDQGLNVIKGDVFFGNGL